MLQTKEKTIRKSAATEVALGDVPMFDSIECCGFIE